MQIWILAITVLGVSGSDVKEPCGLDYPRRGMSRIKDSVCATERCKTTANCTWGCLGEDNPECAWCVYDLELCEKSFGPSMCGQFTYGMQRRQPELHGTCGGFEEPLPGFVELDGYCLKRGHDVPNLPNGLMTYAQATKRCGMSRGSDGISNCKGFWFYAGVSENPLPSAEIASMLDPPKLQCDVDLPAYGMYLLPDPTCINATGDAVNGCIGTDNPRCSRCVYNLTLCKSVFDKESPGMCDEFVKAAKERGAPPCIPKPHSGEKFIRFSTTWDPVPASECKNQTLQQLLGVSLGSDVGVVDDNPECHFNPMEVKLNTQKLDSSTTKVNRAGVNDAWKQCHADKANCGGFSYPNPNSDPPEAKNVKFQLFEPCAWCPEVPDTTINSYFASWELPSSSSSPLPSKVVVV